MTFASPYSGLGRPASGNIQVTIRHFHTLSLVNCGLLLSLRLSSRHSDKLPGTLFETHVTTPKSSDTLWLLGFRVFELPVKGSFQLSLAVLVHYRTQGVFRVGSWCLPFSISIQWLILEILFGSFPVTLTWLSHSRVSLSRELQVPKKDLITVYTPHLLNITIKNSVCSVPLSIAFTHGISIDFFSCGYWDVSLPRVPDPYGFITKSH